MANAFLPAMAGLVPPFNPNLLMPALDNLQDDEKDATRRWLRIIDMFITERDAIYIVAFLHGLLFQEFQERGNSSPMQRLRSTSRTTGLALGGYNISDRAIQNISDRAIQIFCDFIRRTPHLPALSLENLPTHQYRLLLNALHDNTTVKDLYIRSPTRAEDAVFGERVAELLHHRNDLEVFGLDCAYFPLTHLLPSLRHGLPNLRKLGFSSCGINDESLEPIARALIDGNHTALEELDLSGNEIGSDGFNSFSTMTPSRFPRFYKLNLCANNEILFDLDMAQRFIQEILLVPDSTLRELDLSYCLSDAAGYTMFLKALERNRTLVVLNITDEDLAEDESETREPIRDQLIESLPKMTGIRHLICAWDCFHEHDLQLIVPAVRKNKSLHTISQGINGVVTPYDDTTTTPALSAITKRNRYFTHLDKVLGLSNTTPVTAGDGHATTTPTTNSIIPLSLWTRVLNVVGQGQEGASPIFMILKGRLASWPPGCNNNIKKRKHQDAQQQQQET